MTRDTHRQSYIPSSFYKVTVFAAVTIVVITILATLIGNVSFVPSRTYSAVFTDATGVFVGDRVRVSGVEVGSIKSIELVSDGDRKLAKLEFTVEDTVPMYRDAKLQLRYENIVGQRYLAIVEKPGSAPEMPAGETFPVSQTLPALNLTVLFNGFQPLFRALDPEQVNTLSFQLVRSLQGEGGNLRSLMQDTAQLTNALADKEQVIGSVVTNLNTVLATVDTRDQKLTALIVRFRDLMTGLAQDRDVISAELPSLVSLLDGTSSLLRGIRGPLKTDISALNTVAGQLAATRGELDASLKRLPLELRTQARTGSYGSFFNFYVCGADIQLNLLGGLAILRTPSISSNERDTACGQVDQP